MSQIINACNLSFIAFGSFIMGFGRSPTLVRLHPRNSNKNKKIKSIRKADTTILSPKFRILAPYFGLWGNPTLGKYLH